jgi:hypothetical protein
VRDAEKARVFATLAAARPSTRRRSGVRVDELAIPIFLGFRFKTYELRGSVSLRDQLPALAVAEALKVDTAK